MSSPADLSRRRFLRNTFAFSAATALTGCGSAEFNLIDQDPVFGGTLQLLMVGDWGAVNDAAQAQVASAMQAYASKHSLSTDALLMLGDNFYGQMPGGVSSPRWQAQFEQMYPASVFPGPAYAVPGNHDYQNAPLSKFAAQLAYPQSVPSTRWTMPSRYYTWSMPDVGPIVTFVALDSNMYNEPAQPWPPPDPSYYAQSASDAATQLAWLTTTLQQPITTPFLVVIGHHPLYSNGPHGDNQTLINTWDPLLRQSGAHLYLAGHDHDLQHLEFAGHPTSFVSSGAGGAALDTLNPADAARGPYAAEIHGFTHLQIRADLMTVRHLDNNGSLLHKFTKTPAGVVTILK